MGLSDLLLNLQSHFIHFEYRISYTIFLLTLPLIFTRRWQFCKDWLSSTGSSRRASIFDALLRKKKNSMLSICLSISCLNRQCCIYNLYHNKALFFFWEEKIKLCSSKLTHLFFENNSVIILSGLQRKFLPYMLRLAYQQ